MTHRLPTVTQQDVFPPQAYAQSQCICHLINKPELLTLVLSSKTIFKFGVAQPSYRWKCKTLGLTEWGADGVRHDGQLWSPKSQSRGSEPTALVPSSIALSTQLCSALGNRYSRYAYLKGQQGWCTGGWCPTNCGATWAKKARANILVQSSPVEMCHIHICVQTTYMCVFVCVTQHIYVCLCVCVFVSLTQVHMFVLICSSLATCTMCLWIWL